MIRTRGEIRHAHAMEQPAPSEFRATDRPDEFRGTDRFRLIALLGCGASGVVYEVFDREQGVRCALKVLALRNDWAISQFKNEFRLLQGIRHENLVELRELLFDGEHWLLTMELVPGIDIVSYARGASFESPRPGVGSAGSSPSPSPSEQTLEPSNSWRRAESELRARPGAFVESRGRQSFAQLAEGLMALHAANKIHRDVKPSNVLVDTQGRVTVLDFGLATDLGSDGSIRQERLLGTPRYMSPEQAALRDVGAASDWYGVGVVLYEALTGTGPFAGSREQLLWEKRHVRPTPPKRVCPAVPAELSDLCMDLLASIPEQRPRGEQVFARLSPGAAPKRLEGARLGTNPEAIFVGRAAELRTLHQAFARVRKGEALTVVIEAESGIGKTSLVRRFLEQVSAEAEPVLSFSGRCFERESLPYKALDDVMDAVNAHLASLTETELWDVLPNNAGVIAQAFPVLRWLDSCRPAGVNQSQGVEPRLQLQRVFAALRELFARLAQTRPMIVVIDDMQWSDIDSLAVLSALLRPPAAPQMLLVAVRRPGGPLPQMPFWGQVLELALGPLSAQESALLLENLLEPSAETRGVPAHVPELAGEAQGHPLFLREMARHVACTPGANPAPLRLDDVLWRRIVALDPKTRQLVELTCVAGGRLTQGTLASAQGVWPPITGAPLGQMGEPATSTGSVQLTMIGDRIAELRHACLIRTTGCHPNDTIEPYHDRVREAVLAHLAGDELQTHHLHLARALECAERHDAETLAIHWRSAGEQARAYHYARLAAEQAARALAFERAARLFRLSLDLAPHEAAARGELCRQLGDALANAGRGREAAEAYQLAAQGERALEALQLRRLAAEQLLRSGYVAQGIASMSEVLAELGVTTFKNRALALLAIVILRARIRLRGFHYEKRAEAAIPAFELARIDSTWMATICLLMFDQLSSAELQCKNTLLSLRAGSSLQVLRAMTAEAMFLAIDGGMANRERIEPLLAEATQLALELGHPHARAWVSLCRGVTSFFFGDWLDGETQCGQAEATFQERAGARFELTSARVFRGWSSLMRGELREVLSRVPGYVQEAEGRGDLYSATYHMTGFGNLAWLLEDGPEEARRMLEVAESRWQTFHVPRYLNLQAAVHIALYDGAGVVAYQRVRRDWASLRWGIGFRGQMTRVAVRHARAQSALAAFDETRDPRLLHDASRCARAIAGEGVEWTSHFSDSVLAGVELRRGATERALVYLLRAEEKALKSGMGFQRLAMRYRRGELLGGDEGRALKDETLSFLAAQDIRRPERLLAMVFPAVGAG